LLGKVLAGAEGFGHFEFAQFPELSAALILSGTIEGELAARAVFQTTYLDDRWREYEGIQVDQRIIWVLRNPESVITSMLYNWPEFAVNATVRRCGWEELSLGQRRRMMWLGAWSVPRIERACAIYREKLAQLSQLQQSMPAERLLAIDYDQLVTDPERSIGRVAVFLGTAPGHFDVSSIRQSSQRKAERLSDSQRSIIEDRCGELYRGRLADADPGHPF